MEQKVVILDIARDFLVPPGMWFDKLTTSWGHGNSFPEGFGLAVYSIAAARSGYQDAYLFQPSTFGHAHCCGKHHQEAEA